LKKADKFVWDDEAQKAFEALKEEGQAYPVERPVYYVSEVLADAKTHYTQS
jgi:hypothetical protein